MKGWIAIHRRIIDSWIWDDAVYLKRWLDLLIMAAYEPTTWRQGCVKVNLERGQIATSVRKLMKRWGAGGRFINDFLNILEEEKMITREKFQKLTIVTISNYDKYQYVIIPHQKDVLEVKDLNDFSEEEVRSWSRSEQHKEQNNNDNNINNKTSILLAHEENFLKELKDSKLFFEQAAMSLHCEEKQLRTLLDDFYTEILATRDEPHKDISDFKKNFFYWARIHIQKTKENDQRTTKNRKTDSEDKYEARRGTDVGDKKESDYYSSF